MNYAKTNCTTKTGRNISEVRPRFGLSAFAAAAVRGVVGLAALFALFAACAAQAQSYNVLYDFCATGSGNCLQTGAYPQGQLTPDGHGNFYGVTMGGGTWGDGTVFELSPPTVQNENWTEQVIYDFSPVNSGGTDPILSYVIFDGEGNLYGTASTGGANYLGVVFELSPEPAAGCPAGSNPGNGWCETVLWSLKGAPDGANPYNGLAMDSAGNLYGITHLGGTNGIGTVFELSLSEGSWSERVIYDIPSNVGSIVGGVAVDAAGNVFGNTQLEVFELVQESGGFSPSVIHTFKGSPKDGTDAYGTPVLDGAGNVYGTTFNGGAHAEGTVYEVIPEPHGKWREKVLYSFKDNGKDGVGPMAGVVLDSARNIYGTTIAGGKYSYGTVFELIPVGETGHKEKILWTFNGTTGFDPLGSLTVYGGNLYGTTDLGGSGAGSKGDGVVFEVTP